MLKTAKKIREAVDRKLTENSSANADYLSTLTGILAKISEIQKNAYKQLGLKT